MLAELVIQYPQGLTAVVGLLAGLCVLTWVVYGLNRRGGVAALSWGWRVGLGALRLTAMGAVAVSILRPVIVRARVAGERAPVVVVLDDSRSMSVTDSARSPGEWVGIAQAAGLLPTVGRDPEIDSLQANCDRLSTQADTVARAAADLDYARLSGRDVEAVGQRVDQEIAQLQATAHAAFANAAKLNRANQLERTLAYLERIPAGMDRQLWLDHVRDKARAAEADAEQVRLASDGRLYQSNAAVREACEAIEGLSRIGIARKLIAEPGNGLIARLGRDMPVQLFAVSDRVRPIAASNLEGVTAQGTISNLTGGIKAIVDAMPGELPRAIVLFSDGRQVGANPLVVSGVPVYAVGVGARAGFKDVSILNVQVPAQVRVNEPVTVTAEIRGQGFREVDLDATLSAGDLSQSKRVTLHDDRPFTMEFPVQFGTPGLQKLKLEVGLLPGEISQINNSMQRWVDVVSNAPVNHRPATRSADEAEVLDLAGDDGWLGHICETTGGAFFRLDQVDQLPNKLLEIPEDQNRRIEVRLWDSPYLLCLVLGCLTTEWALRKRLGLV